MKGTIRKYIRYNVELMRFIGLWTDADGIFETRFFWIYYLFVTIPCMGLLNLTQFLYILTVLDDIDKLATSAYVFLICIMANIKAVFYWKKFPVFKSILNRLDQEDFQPRNEEQRHETYLSMWSYIWAQVIFLTLFVLTVGLWVLNPMIGTERKLQFQSWYPFNSTEHFMVAYIHQSVGIAYLAFTNIVVDLVTVGLIAYVGAQCDLLSNCLRNLHNFARERIQEEDQKLKTKEEFELKVAKEMDATLLSCVEYHWKILKFSEDVNEIFTTYVFFIFATSLLAICLTLYEMSVIEVGTKEFYSLAVFEFAIFYELLIYCYFGNELIVKSDKIAFSLYECAWVDCSQRFKKDMVFFILRTNLRPIKMTGVNFFVLSLPSFTSIMRASWSFFAMLHQMHNKEQNMVLKQ